jgi:hypothetical protein
MSTIGGSGPSKAERRAAREVIGNYHEAELAKLIEHVREGISRRDAGEIDVFELDDLIHQYKRAAQELWKFCVGRGTGSHAPSAVRMLEIWRAEGDEPDWWEAGAPRRRR